MVVLPRRVRKLVPALSWVTGAHWSTGIKSHCEAEILILGIYSKEITKDIHGNIEWNILVYSSVTLNT